MKEILNKNKNIIVMLFCSLLLIAICIAGFMLMFNKPQEAGDTTIGLDRSFDICQTDYTEFVYSDGFYYYRSAADHFYLYRTEDGSKDSECLTEEVVKELYVLEDWVYFTNLSQDSALYRVKTDGSGRELVCGERIDRFFPIGETFYCMSEEEDGTNKIFSCTTDGEMGTIYEGNCYWLSTDGESLYIKVREETPAADGEAQLQTVVSDREGNILQVYPNFDLLIPTRQALFYLNARNDEEDTVWEIIRMDKETGEETHYEVPKEPEGIWRRCSYAIEKEKLYVLCYSSQEYVFFQYDEESGTFQALCPGMKIPGDYTICEKIEDTFYLVNDQIFVKVFVEDGKGELWHRLEAAGGDMELFEDMEEPSAVDTSWYAGVFRQPAFYREGCLDEDIEYLEEDNDEQGYGKLTQILVPQIAGEIPVAEIINQKIREDVEQFREERELFHEAAKAEDIELSISYGWFTCAFAYAGEHYVSIVYEKQLTTNSGFSGGWEYVTRLYSSETGEELQPEELFSVSPDQLYLRLSFLIRKTERAFDHFSKDLFLGEGVYSWYRTYYCLTDEGLDVFFVEDMRTGKEYHFIISYRELEDILVWDNTSRLKQLIVGEDYFLALYDDGSVWEWGNNAEGKLGAEESFVSVPQRIEGLPRVVKLEDGGNHIFALTEQGDVYTWGKKWEIVRTVPMDTNDLLDAPTPLKGLSEIEDITAKNGTLYAINENGDLYVSMFPWEYGYFYEFYPLQDGELFGEIDRMAAGAGNYDYFIRADGTVFSLMTVAYAGIDTNAYAFIFPHIGDVTPADEDILSYHRPEGLPDITILDEGAKNEFLIYYELTGVEGIDIVSSDPYTVFLSKEDGTLCYWNSDRIKYHDIEFALTNPDTLTERCDGSFVEICIEDVLEMDSNISDIPHIVSIQSGTENSMFLTEDGLVFISKYETYEITDVEYGLWVVSDPSRMPHVETFHDAHLKELTFEKLDLTNIESIWTNGENYFCAVDREGGYYRIKIENNEVTQVYQGLIP